jgi:hypothetical protein
MTSNEQVPFPLRHPRPLTAVELYLECEKEQEAVVSADVHYLAEQMLITWL